MVEWKKFSRYSALIFDVFHVDVGASYKFSLYIESIMSTKK